MTGMQRMLAIQIQEFQSKEMIIGMHTEVQMAVVVSEVAGEIVELEIIRMEKEEITGAMVPSEDLNEEIEIMAGVNMDQGEVDVAGDQAREVKEAAVAKIDQQQEAREERIFEEIRGRISEVVERVAEEGEMPIMLCQMDLRNKRSSNDAKTKKFRRFYLRKKPISVPLIL